MKRTMKILSVLLCLAMLLGLAATVASAAVPNITGVSSKQVADIKINGKDTGIDLTQMILTSGSAYAKGTTGLLNVIEIPAKDPNVTMAVLNGGSYNWSKATMGASVLKYNDAHGDRTIIAAVNGDPWMMYHTDYDGDGQGATGAGVKHVSVSRGLQIIDGEIWATRQMDDENNLHKAEERNTPATHGPTFGVLEDGSFIIGKPNISIRVKNESKSTSKISAGGINRLPAPNSIVLYNQRVGTESMAYEDAYEIYVECDSTAFNFSTDVGGVVKAIYESGDQSQRPAIDQYTVVISARGNGINTLGSCQFAVGDSVSISCAATSDSMIYSQGSKWAGVTDAISGFFTLLENGNETGQPTNSTKYPCSIIGLKADGTAVMLSTTPKADGTRSSCAMMDLPDMCKELGIVHAILFDGGGSTEMITVAADNSYVRRTATVDGTNSVRAVINGLAVVYKGSNMTIANKETSNTAFLPDTGITQAPIVDDTPVADPPADDNTSDKPSAGEDTTPEDEVVIKEAEPSYSYRYMATVESINGKSYTDLQGMRDPAYKSTWTAEEKLASIKPATASDVAVGDDAKVTIAGWALVNGGQGDHYWSVDQKTWYACAGETSNADAATMQTATEQGNVTSPHAEGGRFAALAVDLSAYREQTVTVYFAVEAKSDTSKLCHYLTIESLAVPALPEVETNPPEVETEVVVETEEVTEAVTDAATEAVTDAVTEAVAVDTEAATEEVTDAPETEVEETTKSGCGAALASAPILLLMAGGALMLGKKKED